MKTVNVYAVSGEREDFVTRLDFPTAEDARKYFENFTPENYDPKKVAEEQGYFLLAKLGEETSLPVVYPEY